MKTKSIIFYTEDDCDDQEFFKKALEGIEYDTEVYFQAHGEELLHDLRYHSVLPTLIFLDLNMPRRTGFEVLQEIREIEDFNDIPVIILSTTSDPVSTHRAKNLGANLFLTKPTTINQFTALMRVVLAMDWLDTSRFRQPFYINISPSAIVKAS